MAPFTGATQGCSEIVPCTEDSLTVQAAAIANHEAQQAREIRSSTGSSTHRSSVSASGSGFSKAIDGRGATSSSGVRGKHVVAGVSTTADNSIFGLLHSWFLPAKPGPKLFHAVRGSFAPSDMAPVPEDAPCFSSAVGSPATPSAVYHIPSESGSCSCCRSHQGSVDGHNHTGTALEWMEAMEETAMLLRGLKHDSMALTGPAVKQDNDSTSQVWQQHVTEQLQCVFGRVQQAEYHLHALEALAAASKHNDSLSGAQAVEAVSVAQDRISLVSASDSTSATTGAEHAAISSHAGKIQTDLCTSNASMQTEPATVNSSLAHTQTDPCTSNTSMQAKPAVTSCVVVVQTDAHIHSATTQTDTAITGTCEADVKTDAYTRVDVMQDQVLQLQEELAAVTQTADVHQAKSIQLSALLMQLEASHTASEAQLTSLDEECRQAQAAAAAAKADMARAQEAMAAQAAMSAMARAEVSKMQMALDAAQADAAVARAEAAAAQVEAAAARGIATAAQADAATALASMTRAQADAIMAHKAAAGARKVLDTALRDWAVERAQLASSRQQVVQLQQQLDTVEWLMRSIAEDDIPALANRIREHAGDLHVMQLQQGEAAALECMAEDAPVQGEDSRSIASAEDKQQQEQLAAEQQRNQGLQHQLLAERQRAEAMSTRMHELQGQASESMSKVHKVQQQLELLQREHAALHAQHTRMLSTKMQGLASPHHSEHVSTGCINYYGHATNGHHQQQAQGTLTASAGPPRTPIMPSTTTTSTPAPASASRLVHGHNQHPASSPQSSGVQKSQGRDIHNGNALSGHVSTPAAQTTAANQGQAEASKKHRTTATLRRAATTDLSSAGNCLPAPHTPIRLAGRARGASRRMTTSGAARSHGSMPSIQHDDYLGSSQSPKRTSSCMMVVDNQLALDDERRSVQRNVRAAVRAALQMGGSAAATALATDLVLASADNDGGGCWDASDSPREEEEEGERERAGLMSGMMRMTPRPVKVSLQFHQNPMAGIESDSSSKGTLTAAIADNSSSQADPQRQARVLKSSTPQMQIHDNPLADFMAIDGHRSEMR